MPFVFDDPALGAGFVFDDPEYSAAALPAGVVAWPASFPLPLREGYSFRRVEGREITEMSQGAARVRLQYKNTPRESKFNFYFSRAQLEAFFDFWDMDMAYGMKPVRIPALDESDVVYWDVRFLKMSDPVLTGRGWKLSISVQTV